MLLCTVYKYILVFFLPQLTQPDDHGYTPLLHAIKHGHSSVAKVLLSRELYPTLDHHLVAAQQALVAASTKDNIEVSSVIRTKLRVMS